VAVFNWLRSPNLPPARLFEKVSGREILEEVLAVDTGPMSCIWYYEMAGALLKGCGRTGGPKVRQRHIPGGIVIKWQGPLQ
jgi:hypothetical protein